MKYHSAAYGLVFSSDLMVPWLPAVMDDCASDVTIHFTSPLPVAITALEWTRASAAHDSVCERLQVIGEYSVIRYDDDIQFIIDASATNVWCSWPDPFNIEDVATYLLGPVLALVLRMRGIVCLHASAVEVGEGAILFVGAGGAGKSTIAAAFAAIGFNPICDDVAALDCTAGSIFVRPAYPVVRLWPDSAEAIFGDAHLLPKLTPNWDKCRLDVIAAPAVRPPSGCMVRAVLLLGPRCADERRAAVLERLFGADAVMQLVANSYPSTLLSDTVRQAEMSVLSRVVNTVPIYTLSIADDATQLPSVVSLVTGMFAPTSNAVNA